MNYLGLVKGLVTIVTMVVRYFHDKKLMDAGAAEAVLNSLKEADDAIAKADIARANANSVPVDTDPDNRNR
jgi:putative IMPACT (imprinted ancient) family translation regulator